MSVQLYNTLTRAAEPLRPLKPGTVSIYSCGPTVYDHVHIGNLSAFIAADILRRTIAGHSISVKHVMNFTDVDDKTIKRSQETYPDMDARAALSRLTKEYGELFLEDMKLVGNDTEALTFIQATEQRTIDGMRHLITQLYESGFAYIAEDGVYFSIEAYRKSGKKYGQLVEITEDSTGNERIQNDEYDKESAHDFALWKSKKPGEPAWEFTLNGRDLSGRPGWHIECSVMSQIELGQPFDIHTGGVDLMFPHHENEIAQSTAGKDNPTYATTFVHNEHILVDGKKMAKSAGNFYTLADLRERGVDPLAFRLLVLQSHYRKQTNFSLENAASAHNRLKHWRDLAALRWQTTGQDSTEYDEFIETSIESILAALSDDLNTPEALRLIDEVLARIENTPLTELSATATQKLFTAIDELLGLKLTDSTPDIGDDVKQLISSRNRARQSGDWQESDRLRNQLRSKGVTIRDTPNGAIWAYA